MSNRRGASRGFKQNLRMSLSLAFISAGSKSIILRALAMLVAYFRPRMVGGVLLKLWLIP